MQCAVSQSTVSNVVRHHETGKVRINTANQTRKEIAAPLRDQKIVISKCSEIRESGDFSTEAAEIWECVV